MSIVKAIGRVAEHLNGNNGRIEVIYFKQNGKNIIEPDEIKQHFPPNGYVFAPRFFERFDYELDNIVEFQTSQRPSLGGDSVLMDIDKVCKRVGFPIVNIETAILAHEQSIMQPLISQLINEDSQHFYIQHKGYLYGPFKSQQQEVIPKTGTFVYKYIKEENIFRFQDKAFLLAEPDKQICKVDCMTQHQLANFLKEQIRKLDVNVNIAELKHVIEMQRFDDLDAARVERISHTLEKLEVGPRTLQKLSEHSARFQTLYKEALQGIKAELKRELADPFLEQKRQLDKDIDKLTKRFDQVRQDFQNESTRLEKATAEFHKIESEKNRLIQDIKVHSLVNNANSRQFAALSTYEEQVYKKQGDAFLELPDFIELFEDSFQTKEDSPGRLAFNIVYQLKSYNCFLIENIELIIQLARLSNNCRVYIQQVEPDWLKFEKFYENGLRQIWEAAHENPNMLHFYILQDINMASIECYGRPVLDINTGIRGTLPGLQSTWPENLWLFGARIPPSMGKEIGLPLLPVTFKNWGYIPLEEPLKINKKLTSTKVLNIPCICKHQVIIPSFLTDYFPLT